MRQFLRALKGESEGGRCYATYFTAREGVNIGRLRRAKGSRVNAGEYGDYYLQLIRQRSESPEKRKGASIPASLTPLVSLSESAVPELVRAYRCSW